jgi:hypothetical protein
VLSPDAAVMTATYRVPHLTPRNQPHVIAGAWTAVFVRRDGRWMIVQEHLSDVPPAAAMSMTGDSSAGTAATGATGAMGAMPGMTTPTSPAAKP